MTATRGFLGISTETPSSEFLLSFSSPVKKEENKRTRKEMTAREKGEKKKKTLFLFDSTINAEIGAGFREEKTGKNK